MTTYSSGGQGLAVLLAVSILAGAWASPAMAQGVTFDQAHLTLYTENGRHELTVDIADNKSRTDLGLRYRHSIDPDGGLLILQSLGAPTILEISNQGVSLPMDLLFITSDGTVREVHPWVPTDSSEPIVSNSPVAAALELKGGTITRYGILPGDKVIGGGLGR